MPTDISAKRSADVAEASALLDGDSVDVDALFKLAHNKSKESRQALFETVQEFFVDGGTTLSDRERALMGEILRQLLHDVEMDMRQQLAERLARQADMPHALVVELANDDFEVAHQILLESDVLKDTDLIEVIRHRTMQHQLAVSMRKTVSKEVSQALVETGEEDVVASLLSNHGAAISREVMEYLVSESKRVDRYQNPILRRPDLPSDLAHRMYWWVSAALKKYIATNFDIDGASLDDAIESTARTQLDDPSDQDSSKPEELVDRLEKLNELDPDFLIKALRQGEVSLFEAGICKLSGLRPKLLRRILFEPGGEALALLCRAMSFDTDSFTTIFELTRRAVDGDGDSQPSQRQALRTLYDKTTTSDARRVLRRWRRSSDYLHALKQVGADG
jgi:uncharacterized protein (DUF2336 family)